MAPLLQRPVDLLFREGTDSLRPEVHRLENLPPWLFSDPFYLHIRVSRIFPWLLSSEVLSNSSELPASTIIASKFDKSSMIRVILTNCPDKFFIHEMKRMNHRVQREKYFKKIFSVTSVPLWLSQLKLE